MSREAQWGDAEASTPGRRDQMESGLDPSMITTFLETCMKLLCDSKAIQGLQELITRCTGSNEPHVVRKIGRHALRTGWEMRLTTQIGECDMDQVILDLGLDANILPKKTWDHMGKLALQWSRTQLRIVNQQKILPMGRLQGVTVDIDGVSMLTDFEVIAIVDNSNPYPALLGIDWAMDMKGIINLKRGKMTFKNKSLRVVVPLDPVEGERYTKPMCDEDSDDELDCIYQITT